jgi:DNA-binding transcriptional LysR family regulator
VNTLHLKYAVEVERAGSITKAAERLFMNQPHLSKTIRELEEAMGAAIFERTPKGMFPTPKGAEFLACAKNILAQLDSMNRIFDDDPPGASFRITVPRASYISYAFTKFVKALGPGEADINYMETSSAKVMEGVADGEYDLGIVRCKADYFAYFESLFSDRNLDYRFVFEFERLLLMSRAHPLAGDSVVSCDALGGYVEITHGDSEFPMPRPGAAHDTGPARRAGIAIYERGSQFELLRKIPVTYMWASPMPADVLSTFSLAQKKSDAQNGLHRDFLVYRRDYCLTEYDREFLKHLDDSVREVAPRAE